MASTPEAKVKRRVKELLDARAPRVWYCMPMGTVYGNSGVPDFLICVAGRFLAVETKAGNNRPTALQRLQINKIIDAGGDAFVINEDRLRFLANWLDAELDGE